MPTDDSDLFGSAEEHYADYRPGYGEEALAHLVERFELDGASRVLDLGCGAGQIAVPLAADAGEVVGMDPNEVMLRMASERAETAGRENVEWVAGSDADLGDHRALEPIQLTTMGRSFHWMDQERTLGRLYRMTEPGGGVAVLGDREWLTRGPEDWQAAAHAVAAEYVDDLPERVAPEDVEYEKSWADYLRASSFADATVETFEFEREWDVDAAVGYVLSLSFCSPAVLGDDREAFEDDLRTRLDERDEPFLQQVIVEVTSARK